MDEFLDYLEEEQQRISCLYTTENYEKVYDIGKKLEQFFFVRVVYGRKYELQEQMYLFCKNLDKYKLKLSREAEEELEHFVDQKIWLERDMVEKRIRHLVDNLAYDLLDRREKVIEKEDILKVLQSETEHQEKKRTIGFVIGG